MDRLPDDVILEVLKRVRVEDLLTCRVVCRRLCVLAVHPDAWRGRSVHLGRDISACLSYYRQHADDEPRPTAVATLLPALLLAPCLGALHMVLPTPGFLWPPAAACAVRDVFLYVVNNAGVREAARVVQRQVELGRMRRLEVRMSSEDFRDLLLREADARVLFEAMALAAVSGLEHLTISSDVNNSKYVAQPKTFTLHAAASGALREFSCEGFPAMGPFFDLVVSSSAATLEKLTCEPHPGLDALVASKSLKALTIVGEGEVDVDGAVQLLRQACQLREVTLVHESRVVTGKLVVALASSGQAAAERLTVLLNNHYGNVRNVSVPLLAVLPRLPALRYLSVDWKPVELLKGMRLDHAPALRYFKIETQSKCAHSWVHSRELKRLMLANRALHVRVDNIITCDCNKCSYCARHQQLTLALSLEHHVYFYTHPDGQCPSPEYHGSEGVWVGLPL
ncbi:uncharacterized protein LOC127749021 isoform X2 [Frankliniella occidentalis]|uniref:Uncharacterized protein LOC127749021 isoform X2 n=1 Tax=Frankliniella occidentalis TaxID=133901 RepID=A0A9C6TS63_FRAOC|nr:uncharacterized protein LOC127749021 isoform X2 [Frankliniella occidentalis]XP_052121396.1 uncharacterized protein LOC127749021 isoform X2 [Frankliniella occidentalis]XP_052121397.1 uncharacterized protein LOC127749021 isoform X2 [Frankliniella occidentalis]XP_052121398.1 uncharacterized protein LOC127749021 isoform X2 [Frankliniella occidentalis]